LQESIEAKVMVHYVRTWRVIFILFYLSLFLLKILRLVRKIN